MVVGLFVCSVFLIIYTYLIYPVLLKFIVVLQTINKKEIESFKAIDQDFRVSMVVAAYNEERVIREKMENCKKLDYPEDFLEILIASDGSSDRTNEIIRQYKSPVVRFLDFAERRGKINVLNDVIPHAQGDIIVLSDANTIYEPRAIHELVKHFANPEVGAVCGELKLVNPNDNAGGQGEGIYWKYEVYLKKLESQIHGVLGANGGIYAIRKELFTSVPGSTIIDDFVIPMKISAQGYRVIYESGAVGTEDTSLTMQDEFKRKIRIGAGNFQSIYTLRELLNPFKGYVSFFFWSHKIIRWLVPFFMLISYFSNLALLGVSTEFKALFMMQTVLYACAYLGYTANKHNRNIKILNVPYYFVAMNLALFLGFLRFVKKNQKVTWEKTVRS